MEPQTFIESQDQTQSRAWPSKVLLPAIALVTLTLGAIWLWIPWEWAPIDDPGQVILLGREIAESGRISGTYNRFSQLVNGDVSWGIFRPSYWIFQVSVYQLPISLAHLARLAMVVVAILGPLLYFRRSGASSSKLWFILLLLLAGASTLYQGLFLVSLQELSGAAFIGLGLMATRTWPRVTLWVIAALFKSPFSWILIGYSIFLWRRKDRTKSLAASGLGLGVLAINAVWAKNGDYTSGYNLNPLNPALWENFSRLVEPMNALLLLSVVWWLVVTNGQLKRNSDWIIFFVGWAGYTLQMIPWGVTAYYMGPISYLLAIFMASTITNSQNLGRLQIFIGFSMPAFVAFWLIRVTLNFGFDINSVMLESKQCLAPLSESNTVMAGNLLYVTSSPEGPIQIAGTILKDDPKWDGSIALEGNDLSGFNSPDTTHYLLIDAAPLQEGRGAVEICKGRAITLYELARE